MENDIYKKNEQVLECLKKINIDKYNYYTEKILIKEAKKRGFKEGVYYKVDNGTDYRNRCNKEFNYDRNRLFSNGWALFSEGSWAEIIPTMTKQEAEEKFNCKIV